MNKLLLVDDHPLLMWAMAMLVDRVTPGVQVLSAASAAQAQAVLAEHDDVELTLLDLSLPDADGFDTLAQLREAYPAMPAAVLSDRHAAADVLRAVDLGAMGYICKALPMAELEHALSMVMLGGVFLPTAGPDESAHPPLVPAALDASAGLPSATPAHPGQAGIGPAAAGTLLPLVAGMPVALRYAAIGLTPRQCEVLVLLLRGLPNKLIARELSLSVETVKDHVAAVLRTLGVTSRTQAVVAISRLEQQSLQAHRPTT